MKKKLLLVLAALAGPVIANAQWEVQDSHFPVPGIGVLELKAVSSDVAWAIGTDMSGPGAVPVQYFTRTTDAGLNWQPGTIPGAQGYNNSSITAIDASTAWVSLYLPLSSTGTTDGRIYRTTDGGQTWVQQATNAFNAPQGFINKVHFFDSQHGLAVGNVVNGYFEIYTTQNGGTNWSRVPQANLPAPLANERGYVNVYSAVGPKFWFGTTRGRVFISSDMGQTWTAANTGMTRQDATLPLITNLDFRNANVGLIQNDSTMRKSMDGGLTWSDHPRTGPVHIFDLRYIPGTPGTWMSTGANFVINDVGSSVSHDDGLTWVAIDDSVEHTAIDFLDANTGWTGGLNTNVLAGGMFRWTGPTGLWEKDEASAVILFPNPASNFTFIQLPGTAGQVRVEITDLAGRLAKREVVAALPESGYKLSLNGLEAGIYLVKVSSENQVRQGKLLVR